ncbi:TonB-dependent receptor [Oleiharenicola lentus]|uniref:TonB-dependent receptor n=1 Tax=Oleiharenicola lentus TaxID=2508720 RepID=A0A4V1M634_9BACT|nr:TonB-dependent receptor [Oleiharenicola lentus]RXK53626.1 TonB-dependent receptor [Oleiharenicola lentus]
MCCTSLNRAGLFASTRGLIRSVVSVLAAVALCVPAFAQSPATGVIRGKIQNASNGAYLENATVEIEGTSRIAVTNGYGEFEIRGVPAGEVTLKASYVGQPVQMATVTVAENGEVNQDFTFRGAAGKDGVVQLDPFTVNVERYSNARAVAIAAERNAVNIKNVVSIEEFGEIPSGNVGEFVKFLPGIQIDYGSSNGNNQGYSENRANGVSVRGFGPEDTTILIDGLPVAATVPGNLTRQVGLDQMSINNASRVELIKVATPDIPANSVGGQINLITRSSFEFPKPSYSASFFFNFNPDYFDFEKTPGPVNKSTFKMSPGTNFSASYPFSKTFGVTLSGSIQQEYSQNFRAQPVWNNSWNASFNNATAIVNGAGVRASIANPLMTRYQVTDAPSITDTQSANLRVDWKPSPNQNLRANVQYSTYETAEAQRRLDFRPTLAAGADWNEFQSIGTTANSTTAMTLTTRDRIGDTVSASVNYDINLLGFKIEVAGSTSKSVSDFKDEENGHYSGLDLNLNPSRVALYLGEDGIPSNVETYWRAGGTNTTSTIKDYTQIANWSIADAKAFSGESHNERTINLYKVDVSRAIDFLPFLQRNPVNLKFGARRDEEENVKDGRGTGYRQVLKTGATFVTADIIDDHYVGYSPGFGLRPQQWASTYKLFELNKANNLFEEPLDGADAVNNYNSFVNQNKQLKETTDAWYAMLTGSFLDGRLSLVGGARQESRARVGRTPFTDSKWNYLKQADGSIWTNATLAPNGVRINSTADNLFATGATGDALRAALTAAGISFPTAIYGAQTTDIRSAKLFKQPLREINQKVTGDPSYSLNAAFKLTKKIDLKVAYSRSFKQQPLEDGSVGVLSGNNLTIVEYTVAEQASQNGALGQITVANPGLKPETAQNWDFEVAYYTDSGGKFTASYYTKEVKNATQSFTTYSGTPGFDQALSALGFAPAEFDGWRMVTSANSTRLQKTSGWEFFASQDFSKLGDWGRRFSAFVSFAMTDFPPPSPAEPYTITNPNGTTTTLTPAIATVTLRADRFGGAGLQFSGERFSAQIRGTYRNDNQNGSTTVLNDGTEMRRIDPGETRIDVNLGFMISKNYSLFASGRDVFNGERDQIWRHSAGLLPDYASLADRKRFGAAWSVGVRGTW